MPDYLHPGVYVEESGCNPRPIEGVPTSTAAFLGETERGPVKPRLVTSYEEYERWFGGTFRPRATVDVANGTTVVQIPQPGAGTHDIAARGFKSGALKAVAHI